MIRRPPTCSRGETQAKPDASSARACVFPQGDGNLWLPIRADLAKLYAQAGRRSEAERVADQVRRSLAFADDDHPLKGFRVEP